MLSRADVRPTRRALLFAYLGPLIGSLLPRRPRLVAPRLSIADSLGWLICWRADGQQFAGAS